MKIEWRRPAGTENFDDVKMSEFYVARAEYVRYLQSNKIENLTEADIDEQAIKSLQCLNVLSDVIL
mgnify:CR=1 FL=1